MSDNKMSSGVSDLVKLISSNLITLITAYMLFAGNVSSNENTLLATVLERQKVLEESNATLMARVMALGVQNVELQSMLKENLTRTDLYQTFLDGLPFPAWIKRLDKDGNFRMVMINNAYAHKFNISKDRYQGATDIEVWGHTIADGFAISDRKVYDSRGYTLTREFFPVRGIGSVGAWHSVWKFSLRLGKSAYGIGGVVVVDFIPGDPAIKAEQLSKTFIED